MADSDNLSIEILWGAKELEPVKMWFVEKPDGHYIETDYCLWGPWPEEELPRITRIAREAGMVVTQPPPRTCNWPKA